MSLYEWWFIYREYCRQESSIRNGRFERFVSFQLAVNTPNDLINPIAPPEVDFKAGHEEDEDWRPVALGSRVGPACTQRQRSQDSSLPQSSM